MLCRSDVDDIKSVIETCPETNAVRLNYLYGKLHLNIHTIDYHYSYYNYVRLHTSKTKISIIHRLICFFN